MLQIFQPCNRAKVRRLLSVMLPLIGTQIAIIGMYFFDTSMSGNDGDADLAGAAIGGNVWMPVQTGINGILMAAMTLIANHLGAGEKEKINEVVRHGLFLALAFALVVIISGICFLPMLFQNMGLAADVYHIAIWYTAGLGLGVIPFFMNSPLRCLVDTLGYTHLSMRLYFLALPVNALLNYILIFGKLGLPRLGGIGAGLASGITNWLLFLSFAYIIHKLPKFREYHIGRQFKLSMNMVKEYLGIGVPLGLSIFMETSVFGVVAFFVAKFGTEVIAAHQAALNFSSIIYMVPLSFSLASTIVVGVEYGAKNYQAARDYTRIILQFSVLLSLFYMTAEYIFLEPIAYIYTNNPSVAILIEHFIIYAIMWQFGDVFASPIQGILRGYKDVKATFWSSMLAYWGICLPGGLLLDYCLGHGAYSYWESLVMGVISSAVILLLRLAWFERKLKAKEQNA